MTRISSLRVLHYFMNIQNFKTVPILLSIFSLCSSVQAAPQGKIFGEHNGKSAVYDIEHHVLSTLSHLPKSVRSTTTTNRWVDDSTETQIRIKNARTGVSKVLFNSKQPAALYDALKKSKSKALTDLYQDITDAEPGSKHWSISDTQITNDGKYAYFLTNAGGEQSANDEFCCVKINVATGELSLLNQVFWGQWANIFELSPNSKLLLIGLPDHNTAADNSFTINVIDLKSDKAVDLLKTDPKDKTCVNDVSGACWSPDSRYIAVSIAYFATSQISDDFKPVYNLEIKSASTGQNVAVVPKFSSPDWL